MTQEQLLEQAQNYIKYNLNDEKKLELIINILKEIKENGEAIPLF